MNPVSYIRREVLRLTQQDLAGRLGTTQATVSRWEATGVFPAEYQKAIRSLAREMGRDWNDSWFFEVPPDEGNPQPAEAAAE